MRRRRLVVVLLLLGAAGHAAFWYLPRVRAMAPANALLASPALAASGAHIALWIPYPHQNLGRVPEFEEVVSGLLTALGGPIVGLPRLGPFAIPPAEELLFVQNGADVSVELRLYPLVAGVARLSGWLARNPWLTGGAVQAGDQAIVVSWRGRTWSASSGTAIAESVAQAAPGEAAVAVLRLPPNVTSSRPQALLVTPRAGVLWLHPSGAAPAPELAELPDFSGRQLALAAFGRARPITGLLVFNRPSGASGVPQIAALGDPSAARGALPTRSVLGRELPHQSYPGGEVVALDRISLTSAVELEPLWSPWVEARSGARAMFWIDPAAAAAAATRFDASDWLWLASQDELLRWRGVQQLLFGLRCWEQLAGVVSTDGRQVLLGGERRKRCAP